MNASQLTGEEFKNSYPEYLGQIQHTTTLPEEEASTIPTENVLPEDIAQKFPHDLFTHQSEALHHLEKGENVCVATSTSSGKTMVYALHIARNRLENPNSKALLIYPTKALSRDQEFALNNLYNNLGLYISVQVYDGDTPSDRRKRIRESADVIITNFSGLNQYLAHHSLWNEFFKNIDLVAIDESHSYTGIHGMNVAWTVRRTRRILDHYGSSPQFVLTSATIGNPAEHSKQLTGVDVKVVQNDGSPQGRRDLVFWQPPRQQVGDDNNYASQRPAGKESSEILAHLSKEGLQTPMFTRSRKQTELNAERARKASIDHPSPIETSIEAYHAGHGKKTRRGAENRLKSGDLDGIVTTNALELGIDIGSVDATVLSGYPGTRQSFWQQIGRAGRGENQALGLLVAQHDSIDQYILDNPEYLLEDENIEDAVIDLSNNFVFGWHVLAASAELPLTRDDSKWFDPLRLEKTTKMFEKSGYMVGNLDGGYQYNGPLRPQEKFISMYATTDEQIRVVAKNDDIDMEPIDKQRAYRDFHEGAIVLHKGQQYKVIALNEDGKNPHAKLKATNVDYYTQSLSKTTVQDLEPEESQKLSELATLHRGNGKVNIEYTGYKRKNIDSNKADPKVYSIDSPPATINTQLMWVEVDRDAVAKLRDEHDGSLDMTADEAALGGLHAIEHGLIALSPLELRMDKQDLGGLSQLRHPELDGNGVVFIYDAVSGGVGFSKAIFENFSDILSRTRNMISSCSCGIEGCPACVVEDSCGSRNEPLHTPASLTAIDLIKHQRHERIPQAD